MQRIQYVCMQCYFVVLQPLKANVGYRNCLVFGRVLNLTPSLIPSPRKLSSLNRCPCPGKRDRKLAWRCQPGTENCRGSLGVTIAITWPAIKQRLKYARTFRVRNRVTVRGPDTHLRNWSNISRLM